LLGVQHSTCSHTNLLPQNSPRNTRKDYSIWWQVTFSRLAPNNRLNHCQIGPQSPFLDNKESLFFISFQIILLFLLGARLPFRSFCLINPLSLLSTLFLACVTLFARFGFFSLTLPEIPWTQRQLAYAEQEHLLQVQPNTRTHAPPAGWGLVNVKP
jgi:hypothetical protein